MPGLTAIIDTNVVVSGLLSSANNAPTVQVLDGMLHGRFVFVLSEDLIAEYRTVLLRPGIKRLHGLAEEEVDRILSELVLNGAMRTPPRAHERAPDPGDQHLWDLLATEPRAVLVTGDQDLADNPPPFARIVSPREFVDSHGNNL
jgi:putative PIN family toxin of toxin-antitoxin system